MACFMYVMNGDIGHYQVVKNSKQIAQSTNQGVGGYKYMQASVTMGPFSNHLQGLGKSVSANLGFNVESVQLSRNIS